ncbi:MAG: AAA family ATPase [Ideonella sp.]|nr:AAA family ATPase [Ideonella sp.]
MYLSHFGLLREPFSIAPDPRFLFMSERHQEALAHLRYGLQSSGGVVVLSGEIGAGKTTLCRCLMDQVPAHCQVAYLFNPKLSERELLQSVCADFGIAVPSSGATEASAKDHIDALNQHLLANHAQGRHSVLIVDEAQALSPALLDQLRLLTNLETNERKLLQIVLIGQPELRDMLGRPELEQLAQRVVARFHLQTLSPGETEQYVRHRLTVAGWDGAAGPMPFDAAALRRVHVLSGGVPRRINLLCDRALLGAFARGTHRVRPAMVSQAAREVFGSTASGTAVRLSPRRWRFGATLALGGAAFGLVTTAWWLGHRPDSPSRAAAPVAAARASSPTGAALAASAASATVAAVVAAVSSSAPTVPWLTAPEFAALVANAVADEHEAWRDLALAWLLTPLDGEPCVATAALGVPCHKQRGTLALLRQLDRPALLPLYGTEGTARFSQLLAVSEQGARLHVAGRTVQVSPQVLTQHWRGEFGVLWRAPPGYQAATPQAAGRLDSGWLDAQLLRWASAPALAPKTPAATSLRARVRAFQLAQGLDPDGQVGALTLMQLNRAVGVDEPRLRW